VTEAIFFIFVAAPPGAAVRKKLSTFKIVLWGAPDEKKASLMGATCWSLSFYAEHTNELKLQP